MLDTSHREPPRLRRIGSDDAIARPLRVPTAYGGAHGFELRRCKSEEGYVSLRDIVGSPEYAAASAGRTEIRDRHVKHAAWAYLRLLPPNPPRRSGRSIVRHFFTVLALLFCGGGGATDPLCCFGCSRRR